MKFGEQGLIIQPLCFLMNHLHCHSERSEESAFATCGFFAALRMTMQRSG